MNLGALIIYRPIIRESVIRGLQLLVCRECGRPYLGHAETESCGDCTRKERTA